MRRQGVDWGGGGKEGTRLYSCCAVCPCVFDQLHAHGAILAHSKSTSSKLASPPSNPNGPPARCEAIQDSCFATCPEGTKLSFNGGMCRKLAEVDARVVYFPFLILILLVGGVNIVGQKVKKKHKVLTNFSIMLGAIEHLALFS